MHSGMCLNRGRFFLFPIPCSLFAGSLRFLLDDKVGASAYSRIMAQVGGFRSTPTAQAFLWISSLFVSSLLPYSL